MKFISVHLENGRYRSEVIDFDTIDNRVLLQLYETYRRQFLSKGSFSEVYDDSFLEQLSPEDRAELDKFYRVREVVYERMAEGSIKIKIGSKVKVLEELAKDEKCSPEETFEALERRNDISYIA